MRMGGWKGGYKGNGGLRKNEEGRGEKEGKKG